MDDEQVGGNKVTKSNTGIPRLLEGRLAFITGAGQGNGRALALGLAAAGARVIVTDMNAASVAETAELVRKAGGESHSDTLNVTDSAACKAMAERVGREIGTVDLLVNNAGIIIRENSESPNAEKNWNKTMDVNVNGTFNVTHAFLPALKASKGSIVNVASIAAYAGQGGSLGYSPSKGAIKMLTQSWAAEFAQYGIRVNALAPGVIATPMTAATREDPEKLQKFTARIPMGRVGQPDELVGPVVFLASHMSTYVTGVTLPIDGGFLAA
ncbi:glucose 1-dehydrogenase [Ferrovibrio sp.]|uniref:SDR family NAD(P)-dependent oxidoreductase n=1 Tax=Ferrovibrio sp. TaxID=1917215 RepID=UPI00311FE9DC